MGKTMQLFQPAGVALAAFCLLTGCAAAQSDSQPAAKSANAMGAGKVQPMDASAFVDDANARLYDLYLKQAAAEWVRQTYITHDTQLLAAEFGEQALALQSQLVEEAKQFNGMPIKGDAARAIELLKLGSAMPAPNDPDKRAELARIAVELDSMYGKGKYCPDGPDSCQTLNQLETILANSRDYDELKEAWAGWRTISPPMREKYQRFAELTAEGARELGYSDLGTLWRSGYDMPADDFEAEAERLWTQVRPLYEALHCHVRAKLGEQYGTDKVPQDGPIPAHLLGNMWSQQWNNIYDLVEPYPGAASPTTTTALVEQNYDAVQMVELAESFFTSLGMPELPDTFYERSLLTKPADREVVCHASAWPLDGKEDVRIKMCIEQTEEMLTTIYHELGHIYYFLIYKDQPLIFQNGAHDGFHEAIGDTIVLSMTPDYLKSIGLLDEVSTSDQAVINNQMKMALEKIAFLPFGKLVDQWRWDVFSGKTSPADYNKAWWEQRTTYQGIAPPVPRSEADFDPGAKYHVPGNTPYTRYFLSFILQFQFHQALCEAIGFDGPLHECSIYDNKEAGRRFSEMMALGQSAPWQVAFEKLTGTRSMDGSAIIDYFQPLLAWLEQQNQGRSCGW
ncbi:MAG: M2 family metallopeptidase [Xanthomonadales bacterium]|nr:M2 family metallopeptidase [Xanthomonadales bacterium]